MLWVSFCHAGQHDELEDCDEQTSIQKEHKGLLYFCANLERTFIYNLTFLLNILPQVSKSYLIIVFRTEDKWLEYQIFLP